jgi:hypothetical protein
VKYRFAGMRPNANLDEKTFTAVPIEGYKVRRASAEK